VVGEEEHSLEEPQVLVVQVVVAPQRRPRVNLLVQVALQIQAAVVVVEDIRAALRLGLAVVPVVPASSFFDIQLLTPSPTPVVVLHLPLQLMAILRLQFSLPAPAILNSLDYGTLRISR
jgi:hypothetical protein